MKYLNQPLFVKGMQLRNRLVMPPMVTNFASEDGAVTNRMIRYYSERAKGGVGLIIVEMTYPHVTGKAFPCMLGVHDEKFVPGLNELSEAIKSYGACAGLQIGHAGRQTSREICGRSPMAPSAVPLKGSVEPPQEMLTEEIHEMVRAFGSAALRAKRAGFDAVELHGTHGYLLNQFLSPYTNQRSDSYGGSFENRLRFPVEVVQEVRAKIGEDYPLILRLCANEYLEGAEGITLELAKKIAPRLVEAGIDILHVTGGIGETGDHLIQPLYYDHCYNVYLAEGVKHVVGITPVIAAGSVIDPHMADQILEQGKADLIAVGRGLIADPMFPKKAEEQRAHEIRRCIRCNECSGRLRSGFRISCAVNPLVGDEAKAELKPATKTKRVLVAGAGPAGMETARILALRGHEVTLCERSDSLGGLLRIASVPNWKKDLLSLMGWLERELERSDVTVRCNTEVTSGYIHEFNPDVLVVATGSIPSKPTMPGIESSPTAVEVFQGAAVADNVIVCGGGLVGCEVGWYLAEQNKAVTIVEMLHDIGMDMEPRSRIAIVRKLGQHNVKVVCDFRVESIVPGEGVIGIEKDGGKREVSGQTMVVALGFDSNRLLADSKSKSYETYVIGDAKEPRRIIDAIREANHISRFEI
jgi:2,4-dienoyl-CoA reductase-like NADH-dependent reductase (Old Yellow Enzyme family)/thioredoxin reductase